MKINCCIDKSIWPSLLLLPLANMGLFLFYASNNASLTSFNVLGLVKQGALLIVIACAEEVFFRGLLLRELVFGYGVRPLLAAIIVNLLFGLMHIFNVFSYASLYYAVVQGICACAVGMDLAAVYCKHKSIVLCTFIHGLINITSIGLDGSGGKLVLSNLEASIFLIVAALYLVHGYRMLEAYVSE